MPAWQPKVFSISLCCSSLSFGTLPRWHGTKKKLKYVSTLPHCVRVDVDVSWFSFTIYYYCRRSIVQPIYTPHSRSKSGEYNFNRWLMKMIKVHGGEVLFISHINSCWGCPDISRLVLSFEGRGDLSRQGLTKYIFIRYYYQILMTTSIDDTFLMTLWSKLRQIEDTHLLTAIKSFPISSFI